MKKFAKITVLVMAVVLVFAFATTAFAVGETIEHSGWSELTYCSGQTVQQKNDTRFYCKSASKTAKSDMLAYVWANRYRDNALLGQISSHKQLNSGITLIMPKNPTVRVVCIRIANNGDSIKKRTYTYGNWEMRA